MSTLRIAYGVMGEGRGHTVRALALGQRLIDAGHEVRFFTMGQSEDLLKRHFGDDAVQLTETPRFVTFRSRLLVSLTALRGAWYWLRNPIRVRRCINEMRGWRPDVVISDFEPTMPRVARRLGVPCISFDSQHFTRACDLRQHLPMNLRMRLAVLPLLTWIFDVKPSLVVISKPFSLPTRREGMHMVGPMLRPSLERAEHDPSGTHVLCYSRARLDRALTTAFEHARCIGLEVRLYGHHPAEVPENVRCMPISDEGFVRDMLSADAVICTSGSQLIGELAVLGIPSVLLPEPGQVEQEVNARLAAAAYGNFAVLRPRKVQATDFSVAFDGLRSQPNHDLRGGADRAAMLILQHLGTLAD